LILMLYRDDYYNADSDKKEICEVIVSKNKNGSIGAVDLDCLNSDIFNQDNKEYTQKTRVSDLNETIWKI